MAAAQQSARRRVDLPFAATAILLFGAGAAGEAAQVALGGALEEALRGATLAALAVTLALFAGAGIGATLVRQAPLRRARPLLVAGATLVALGALELVLLRAWHALAPAPPIAR